MMPVCGHRNVKACPPDPHRGRLFGTGKNWSRLHEIAVDPVAL